MQCLWDTFTGIHLLGTFLPTNILPATEETHFQGPPVYQTDIQSKDYVQAYHDLAMSTVAEMTSVLQSNGINGRRQTIPNNTTNSIVCEACQSLVLYKWDPTDYRKHNFQYSSQIH